MTDFKYDVFLSYSRRNSRFVDWLHRRLRSAKLRIWRDQRQMTAGDAAYPEIAQAIRQCRLVVCVISKSYLRSGWCLEETKIALAEEASGGRVDTIPLRLDDSDPESVVAGKVWVDFRDRSRAKASLEELLRAVMVRLEAAKPSESPYFDDPASYQLWNPWRAHIWYRCRKEFWYEFVVSGQKFRLDEHSHRQLLSLRASRSIAGRLGYVLRTEMRRHLKNKGVSATDLRSKLETVADQERKGDPAGLVEVNNRLPRLDERIANNIDVIVSRYERWIGGIANPWLGSYIFPDTPKYQRFFRDWHIHFQYVPFAERGFGRAVLFVENVRRPETEKRVRRRFLGYLLARARVELRSATTSRAEVLYLDGSESLQLYASDDEVTLHERRLWAAGERFHRSRRIHPVTAQPQARTCSRCKFLSICIEGRLTIGSTFDRPLIPSVAEHTRAEDSRTARPASHELPAAPPPRVRTSVHKRYAEPDAEQLEMEL